MLDVYETVPPCSHESTNARHSLGPRTPGVSKQKFSEEESSHQPFPSHALHPKSCLWPIYVPSTSPSPLPLPLPNLRNGGGNRDRYDFHWLITVTASPQSHLGLRGPLLLINLFVDCQIKSFKSPNDVASYSFPLCYWASQHTVYWVDPRNVMSFVSNFFVVILFQFVNFYSQGSLEGYDKSFC